ncbi:MAG TPA: hypothetical protein DCE42_29075 [Myxococcales bacterium]|nr:hypothetical protein [Deltaproteobacteria bacterium]HAA58851.1 hypothetical protein [Myxococcales bacterium]|tara:strand:+ start:6657 stop:6866 length:210 start_codon:yes stop_codon:yes gene_type:complete
MDWRPVEQPISRIPYETLRRLAEEWLGPERSFDELDPREQDNLITDIEADINEDMMQRRIVTIYDDHTQ